MVAFQAIATSAQCRENAELSACVVACLLLPSRSFALTYFALTYLRRRRQFVFVSRRQIVFYFSTADDHRSFRVASVGQHCTTTTCDDGIGLLAIACRKSSICYRHHEATYIGGNWRVIRMQDIKRSSGHMPCQSFYGY